jgi:hypothetical protein
VTTIHTIHTELTQWHTSRQPYRFEGEMSSWDTYHTTQVPPLIDQLNNADKRPAELDLGGGTPSSKPTANLEALDTLIHIDNEASTWVRKLGHDDPGNTIACITKVYSLAAGAKFCGRNKPVVDEVERRVKIEGKWQTRSRKEVTCCIVHHIERDMRRWWTQARIASGWDSTPWKPNNTCPHCDERRSLRIRPDDRAAFCVGCRETWDAGTIGILAEHVRAENGEELVS